jgi:hypothetical protein
MTSTRDWNRSAVWGCAILLTLGNIAHAQIDPEIVYQGDGGIAVANSDGTNRTLVVAGEGANPSWSPDGTRFVYESGSAIYVIEIDRTTGLAIGGPTKIADTTLVFASTPAWNPVSDLIVFSDSDPVTLDTQTDDLFLVNANAIAPLFDREPLTDTWGVLEFDATWSPDGTKVAFARASVSNENWELAVIDDLANPVQRTVFSSELIFQADWANSNDLVMVEGNSSPAGGLTCVDVRDGGVAIQVLTPADCFEGTCKEPSWSPNDSQIVFREGQVIRTRFVSILDLQYGGTGCPTALGEPRPLITKQRGKEKLPGSAIQPDWWRGLPCADNSACDDGRFCNGAELCDAGTCMAALPPMCDPGESCNEETNACEEPAQCTLGQSGDPCSSDDECCSDKCKGKKQGGKTCRS